MAVTVKVDTSGGLSPRTRGSQAEAKAAAMKQVMDNLTKRNEAMRIRTHAFAQLANDLGIKLTKSQLAALDALDARYAEKTAA